MDHNSSYRGPIWVIKKPNINFIDASTISMKKTSSISIRKISPKIWIVCGVIFTSHVNTIEHLVKQSNFQYIFQHQIPSTRIWSNSRLKDLSIESKNVRIGVRTKKIWSFKVGGLNGCRGYAITPKPMQFRTQGCSFEAQPRNSMASTQ